MIIWERESTQGSTTSFSGSILFSYPVTDHHQTQNDNETRLTTISPNLANLEQENNDAKITNTEQCNVVNIGR